MAPSNIINDVTQKLINHGESLRIKKLIVYACQHRWENDPEQLNKFDFLTLITNLKAKNPSLEKLRDVMDGVVQNLNRRHVYSEIANIIIANLSELYNDSEESTEIVFVPLQVAAEPPPILEEAIELAVHNLSHNDEYLRISKLIYCLARKRWPSNVKLIEESTLGELLREIKEEYLTLSRIEAALLTIVKSLNRRSLYAKVARSILKELAIIYRDPEESTGILQPLSFSNFSGMPLHRNSQISGKNPDSSNALTEEEKQRQLKLSKETVYDYTQSITMDNGTVVDAEMLGEIENQVFAQLNGPKKNTSAIAAEERPPREPIDSFKVRLGIMKYANPLRAKILLFSLVNHPFDWTEHDWAGLRACDLDELIKALYENYHQLKTLQTTIIPLAESLRDPEEHLQAASVIIKTLSPFYK